MSVMPRPERDWPTLKTPPQKCAVWTLPLPSSALESAILPAAGVDRRADGDGVGRRKGAEALAAPAADAHGALGPGDGGLPPSTGAGAPAAVLASPVARAVGGAAGPSARHPAGPARSATARMRLFPCRPPGALVAGIGGRDAQGASRTGQHRVGRGRPRTRCCPVPATGLDEAVADDAPDRVVVLGDDEEAAGRQRSSRGPESASVARMPSRPRPPPATVVITPERVDLAHDVARRGRRRGSRRPASGCDVVGGVELRERSRARRRPVFPSEPVAGPLWSTPRPLDACGSRGCRCPRPGSRRPGARRRSADLASRLCRGPRSRQTVSMTPSSSTSRMRSFSVSAIRKPPPGSAATPPGCVEVGLVGRPAVAVEVSVAGAGDRGDGPVRRRPRGCGGSRCRRSGSRRR